jgi:histone H3/H4
MRTLNARTKAVVTKVGRDKPIPVKSSSCIKPIRRVIIRDREKVYCFAPGEQDRLFSDYNRNSPDHELQEGFEEGKDETCFTSIDKGYFAQVVYEISDDICHHSSKYQPDGSTIMWSELALEALQCQAEDYLAELFKHSNLVAFHRDSDVVEIKDLQLAQKLTGFNATSGALVQSIYMPERSHSCHMCGRCGCQDGDNGIIDLEIDLEE